MERHVRRLPNQAGEVDSEVIIVVDMNWKPDSLAFSEFVSPIVSTIEGTEPVHVIHYLELTLQNLKECSRVILSGTTLKDFEFQRHLEKFRWLKTWDKPVLGICAGMQIISLVFGVPLADCYQVGMTEISTAKENLLFDGTFKAYTLHSFSVTPSETFEVLANSENCIQVIKHKQKHIYGILFHPEVRNIEILKKFVLLANPVRLIKKS